MKNKFLIIQVLLVTVFLACVGYIGKYFYDSRKAQEGYEELRQLVKKSAREDATEGYIELRDEKGMLEDYYDLYKKNNDFKGWLRIPGTAIDYPVVQCGDNDFYLHRNFEKKYQYSGIPFIDYQSSDNSMNMIIYAHNMKNGSMFAALTDYEDKAFYEQHKDITYDTIYDRGKYEIIGAFRTKVDSKEEFKYYEYANIETEERFGEYLENVKKHSFYDTGVEAGYGDRLLTLSTCAYHTSNERFVVVAKKK